MKDETETEITNEAPAPSENKERKPHPAAFKVGNTIGNRFPRGHTIGNRFPPGVSGNPGGRPRRQAEIDRVLDRVTAPVIEVVARKALDGDLNAAAILLRAGVAPPKAQQIPVDIGPLDSLDEVVRATERVANALASGTISPGEVAPLIVLIETAKKRFRGW